MLSSHVSLLPIPADIEELNISTNTLLPSWSEVAKMAGQLPRLTLLNLRSGTQHVGGKGVGMLQSTVHVVQQFMYKMLLYCAA